MSKIQILIALCALASLGVLTSCVEEKSGESEVKTSTRVNPENENGNDHFRDPEDSKTLDESPFQDEMNALTGIEKYFVQGDLAKYSSLLKYQGNDDYKKVEDALPVSDAPIHFIEIKELDARNGFIKYHTPGIDCTEEMTYWIKKDGNHLIATTQTCCTMFCEGDIEFQLYNTKAGTYTSLATKDVVTDFEMLDEDRKAQQADGGIDYQFVLPQEGLYLQYCLGDLCVELEWKDGTFAMEE